MWILRLPPARKVTRRLPVRALAFTTLALVFPGFVAVFADDCLICHEKVAAPVSGIPYADSIHGQLGLECTACHIELSLDELPHVRPIAPVDCGLCHDALDAVAESVHGGEEAVLASCVDCHGAHDVLPSSERGSRTHMFNVSTTCGSSCCFR